MPVALNLGQNVMIQGRSILLALVPLLSACDQHVTVERILPLDHQGSLKVRAARVNYAGEIVVLGESTALGLEDSGLKRGHPDLHGDLRVLGSDNMASLSVAFTGTRVAEGIVADSSNPSELYLWSQQAARFSDDKGITWRDLSATLPYVSLSPGYVKTAPSGIFFVSSNFQDFQFNWDLRFRENRNGTWRKLAVPAGVRVGLIDSVDPCFMVSQVTNIVSHDCGSSWVSNGNPVASIFLDVVDPHFPGLAYAAAFLSGTTTTLYRTEDGGRAWTPLPLPFEWPIGLRLVIDPERPGVLYAVGSEKSWRGVNRGESWEPMAQPFPFSYIQTDFVKKRHYATKGGDNTIYVLSSDLKEVSRTPVPQVVERLTGLIDGRLYVSVRPVPDIFIARFRQNGELIAYTELGGVGADAVGGMDLFPDGDILITGTSDDDTLPATSRIGTNPRGFVARISADLKQIRWLTRVPSLSLSFGSSFPPGSHCAVGPDGSVYLQARTDDQAVPVTARPFSVSPFRTSSYFMRLSGGQGALVASALLGTENAGPISVQPDGDAVFGSSGSLIRLSADAAAVRWVSPAPEIGHSFTSLSTLPNGGFIAAGNRFARFSNQEPFPEDRGVIHRFEASGAPIARSMVGGTRPSSATAAAMDRWGNVLVGGTTESNDMPLKAAVEMHDAFGSSGYLIKFDMALQERVYSTHIHGFSPAGIFPLSATETLLVGSGLRSTDRPNPYNDGAETITFVRVIESAGTLPRLDRMSPSSRAGGTFGADRYFPPGGTAMLSGEWPAGGTSVSIDGVAVPSEAVDTKTLRITLPSELSSGYHSVRVHTGESVSNTLLFPVP